MHLCWKDSSRLLLLKGLDLGFLNSFCLNNTEYTHRSIPTAQLSLKLALPWDTPRKTICLLHDQCDPRALGTPSICGFLFQASMGFLFQNASRSWQAPLEILPMNCSQTALTSPSPQCRSGATLRAHFRAAASLWTIRGHGAEWGPREPLYPSPSSLENGAETAHRALLPLSLNTF